jgi:hypothetical protein
MADAGHLATFRHVSTYRNYNAVLYCIHIFDNPHDVPIIAYKFRRRAAITNFTRARVCTSPSVK